MCLTKDKNPIVNLIGRDANKPINKDLSHLILSILCENRKSIGVFKDMLVANIRDKILNSDENVNLGNFRDEQDLSVRVELYKLKRQGITNFKFKPFEGSKSNTLDTTSIKTPPPLFPSKQLDYSQIKDKNNKKIAIELDQEVKKTERQLFGNVLQ